MRILTATIATAVLGGLGVAGVSALAPQTADAATTTAAIAESAPAATAKPPALGWRWFSRLTADQKACLDKASVNRPIGPLTEAERATVQADLRAAAEGCGIKVPSGERRAKVETWWKSLSADQQACLKKANLSRPLGPLSAAERKQLRTDVAAAARACSVTLPK